MINRTEQPKTIADAWTLFAVAVIPPDAPEYQITDLHSSFYAGAISLLRILDAAVQRDTTLEAGSKRLDEIADELRQFADQKARGQ